MSLDERAFFSERPETRQGKYTCPKCRRTNDYPIRWVRRTKKDRPPSGADENDRATIVSNAAVQVFMRGVSDATATHIESRLGQRTQSTISLSTPGQARQRMTETHGSEYVPVLRGREILQMPFGSPSALVLISEQRVTPKPILSDMHRELP